MKVIIPVAGRGTRLRPYTDKRQKCLLPVAGKPVIDHIVEPLINQGFDDIVLVTGYFEEQLRDYVKKFNATFSFVPQAEPLGLGDAVFQGLDQNDDAVLIHLGDVIYDTDFRHFCREGSHRIAVNEVLDPERFGIVEIKDERVTQVVEKPKIPPSNLAIIGLYFFSNQRSLWQSINYLIEKKITTGGEIQLADALDLMAKNGETITVEYCDNWYDCGVPSTFLSTNRQLLKSSSGTFNGSTIKEPVYIGANCKVLNSTIGPYVTVMDGATITDSVISDSIVLWDACLEGKTLTGTIVEEG